MMIKSLFLSFNFFKKKKKKKKNFFYFYFNCLIKKKKKKKKKCPPPPPPPPAVRQGRIPYGKSHKNKKNSTLEFCTAKQKATL